MSLIQGIFDSLKWLTVFGMILCLLNVAVVIRYAVPFKKDYRWIDFIPGLGAAVAVISFLYGDTSVLALLIYTSTAILFVCTGKRMFKPAKKPMSGKFRLIMVLVCVCGTIPTILALTSAGEVRYNPVSDLSKMSYSKAFAKMNERLSVEYPFGEWKKIDWNGLKNKYEPIFAKAETDHDQDAYYKALREYLFSLRDGHVKIANENLYDDNKVFKQEVGGGFGLSAIQLDNGKVLVNLVLEGSPADKSGIRLGAEIIAWDGRNAQEAYAQSSWSENPMATEGDRIYNQGRFMTRAPIGKQIRVEFKNRNESDARVATLEAYDDQYETLKKTKIKLKKEDAPLEGEMLGNGYGYVKIKYFLPGETQPDPEQILQQKLNMFLEKKVKGLIIDLRDNPGGDDNLAAQMAGHFVSEEKVFEHVSYYNRNTGKFEINRMETRIAKPTTPFFAGNIAILVNQNTVSSGEGLPLALKGLPNVKIVGFTSTNGSFGVMTAPIEFKMPEGYIVRFPDGRSLDRNLTIQGDSDYNGQGGAAPDIRIPLNEQTFTEKYVDGQDVELNYAIAALQH
ncbi:S41 family peptidase [Paenibacillus sp. GCM10027626]|uniref:S41 family peptidase n=1 Tax=Paenibacillus sp. GCM10027626 TaxID=3273411 RepID=UPI003637B12C